MAMSQLQVEALNAYQKHGTQQAAADSLGISRRAFRNRYDGALAQINDTPVGFKTTKVSTDGNNRVTGRTHKLAPTMTEDVREGQIIKRSTLYGADGNVTAEWVMRKPEDEASEDFYSSLEKKFTAETVGLIPMRPLLVESGYNNKEDLAVFLSVDDHIGVRLTQQMEGQDYGLKDAVRIMTEKFTTLIQRTAKTERCLYVNLGDKFHANDHMDVTPKSKHPMGSDSDFDTVADAVIELEISRINQLLRFYAFVDVRGVRGNHDVDPTGWLYRCLALAFRDNPRVSVEFYSDGLGVHQFGNTMLGFHHGDKMKPDAMAGACADRYKEVYGETFMRYLHTGHIHHDSSKDLWGGFKWESHRTAAPKDGFSYSNGYLSRQTMKSIVYNITEGEVGRYQTSIC